MFERVQRDRSRLQFGCVELEKSDPEKTGTKCEGRKWVCLEDVDFMALLSPRT